MILHRWWLQIWSSLWFIPGLLVVGAVGAAVLLVDLTLPYGDAAARRWPRLFGAGADGARGMLTAVATSMITVAGVVFSITIVALSLASSQYTSRVLRNFMKDRTNQTVLGVFVGIFAYCLVVLRTIRSGDEGAFVPSIAVLGGGAGLRRHRLPGLLHPPHRDRHPGLAHPGGGGRGNPPGGRSAVSRAAR